MPLEDPSTIDIVTMPAPGRVELVIADAGVTREADKRLSRLLRKLQGYATYATSAEFAAAYPGIPLAQISILVVCRRPPTPAMAQIAEVLTIPVRFEVFDPEQQAPGKDTFMTRALARKPSRGRAAARRVAAAWVAAKRIMRR